MEVTIILQNRRRKQKPTPHGVVPSSLFCLPLADDHFHVFENQIIYIRHTVSN